MDNKDKQYLLKLFAETTRVTFLLAFLPILTLLTGVILDKQLATTPIFMIISFVSGILIMIFSAKKIKVRKIT